MGRKQIPRNQRAQPISFSLKPHIIEKIDNYSHDLRFSRSKFLEEAVTRYMLATDMEMIEKERMDRRLSESTNDMTPDQKVAMALATIQKANREGFTISKSIMDNLRRELGIIDKEIEIVPKTKKSMNLKFKRIKAGEYNVEDAGMMIGIIYRELTPKRMIWIAKIGDSITEHTTLGQAKEWFSRVNDGVVHRG